MLLNQNFNPSVGSRLLKFTCTTYDSPFWLSNFTVLFWRGLNAYPGQSNLLSSLSRKRSNARCSTKISGMADFLSITKLKGIVMLPVLGLCDQCLKRLLPSWNKPTNQVFSVSFFPCRFIHQIHS